MPWSVAAYQKYENPKKCNITLKRLEELAAVFNRSVDFVLREQEN